MLSPCANNPPGTVPFFESILTLPGSVPAFRRDHFAICSSEAGHILVGTFAAARLRSTHDRNANFRIVPHGDELSGKFDPTTVLNRHGSRQCAVKVFQEDNRLVRYIRPFRMHVLRDVTTEIRIPRD